MHKNYKNWFSATSQLAYFKIFCWWPGKWSKRTETCSRI